MAGSIDANPADPDVRFWLEQIEGSQKWHNSWHERGKAVVERYMDKSDESPGVIKDAHKMNMLWSNVQTTQPALYAKSATPKVQRRFRDKDPVGRWAAIVLERCQTYELDAYDDDYHYRTSILDYLLPGRGQVWVYYEPTLENNVLKWECCKVRHLHWKDFITNPARTWDEVWWVAKREYLTKEEAKAQKLDVASLTFEETKETEKTVGVDQRIPKAIVWEIWSKLHGKVYFASKSSPKILREPKAPAITFEGFFPCPRPLVTTTTPDSILPAPDFVQYQNQAAEIDRLSQRINLLTKALRVAAVYDGSQEALGKLLDNDTDNVMIACETYAVLAAQGGVEGSVSFFPLKDIIVALKQCYESREQAKAAMYEITGISDIVRGATNPDETATAQQLKSQWGGLRIRDRQKEVQRFIRDVMRLKAEVYCAQFQPSTLRAMSNVPLADQKTKQQLQQRQQAQQMAQQNPQQAQAMLAQNPQLQALAKPLTQDETQQLKEPAWEEVAALLKDQKLRGFRIDIETDSTIQADEAEEKTSRTEFIGAMTSFMEAWGPMVQQQPKLAQLAGEMLMFGARAFKTADTLETAIEEFVDTLEQMPAPQQGANPEMAMVQVKDQERQDNLQLEQAKISSHVQIEQVKTQAESERHAQETAQEAEIARVKQESEERLALTIEHIKARTAIAVARISAKATSGASEEGYEEVRDEELEGPMPVTPLRKAIAEMTQSVSALADSHAATAEETRQHMVNLHQALTSEKQIVRDPKTGKATGLRIKASNAKLDPNNASNPPVQYVPGGTP